jgi:hypothetical protein
MRRCAALIVLAGCGATLQTAGDAGDPTGAHDATPRPCAGGDAHALDGSGTCFVWFRGPEVWTDAKAACIGQGAQLAIITSAAQNTVIDGLARGFDTFLGATDMVTEGTFLWVDGTPVTYANYRAGVPNNGGGTYEEDCLVIEGSKTPSDTWDDRPCAPPPAGAGAYGYLCSY